ncbi:MAG: NAD(P)/FAD-dependent oxidoreductase [Stackebrandtia sp.]
MTAEFVIVGGGAHGCAVAYHLAKAGAAVTLLEAGAIGQEASGGSGKRGVRANRRDLRELGLMTEAYELWPGLADELEHETGYERTGGVYLIEEEVVGTSGGWVAARAHADAQNRIGVPTEVWDADRIREVLPGISENIKGGIHTPLDGVASQTATTRAYARAAHRHGARLIEGTAVASLRSDSSGRVTAVVTDTGEVIAASRDVLLANNSAAAQLAEDWLGVRLPMWNIYPQALFLRAENSVTIPLLTGHESRALSVKILDGDVIMLSGGWRGKLNAETGRGELVQKNIDGNLSQLTSVFPGLGELELLEADASRAEAVSVDAIPFIGPISANVFVAAGWSAHGWALVPAASKRIAELLLTGESSAVLDPFSPARIKI